MNPMVEYGDSGGPVGILLIFAVLAVLAVLICAGGLLFGKRFDFEEVLKGLVGIVIVAGCAVPIFALIVLVAWAVVTGEWPVFTGK